MQSDKPESEVSPAQSQSVDRPKTAIRAPWPPIPIPSPIGGPPPPPPAPPGLYTIALDGFTASTIRSGFLTNKSWEDDTDYVSMAAQVNNQPPVTAAYKVGRISNEESAGIHLQLGPLSVGPNDTLTFSYIIVNRGSGDTGTVIKVVAAAAAALLGYILDEPASWMATADKYITEVLNFVFADCDGTVAADKLVFSGNDLANKTATWNGDYAQSSEFPGTDAPWSCGGHSDYIVIWDIQRVPPPPPPFPFTPVDR